MDKKVIKIVIIIVLLVSLIIPNSAKSKGDNSNGSTKGRDWNIFSLFGLGSGKVQNKKQKSSFFSGFSSFMNEINNYILKLSIVVFIINLFQQMYKGHQQQPLRQPKAKVAQQVKESCLAEPQVIDYQQQDQLIQDLEKKMLLMRIQAQDGAMALNCRLNVSSLNRLTNIAFYVGLEGSDELGKCNMNGYLAFVKDGFKFRLVKKSEDVPQLVFQGFGNAAEASGQWMQLGHQNDIKHSGTWSWVSQIQQQ